ncbi:MAG: histidine phosphatase family protein [Flavobacteriaceae bacterium]
MKTLYLLRHAKSSWEEQVDDHKRSLNERGKNDAILVSNYVKDIINKPQKIVSSDANRAKTTAKYFKEALDILDTDFILNPNLYDFGGKSVMEVIKGLDNTLDSVMIVGHNHALTSIANMLGDTDINNIATCGFVEIKFNVDTWKFSNYGHTERVIFPRDLKSKNH